MSAWQMARRLFDSEGTEISYDEERESVSEQMSLTVKMGSGVLRIRENDDVQEKWTCGMARLHVCEMRISQVLVKMYVVSLKEQASTLLSGRNCCESVQLDLVTASAYEIPQINLYSVYLFCPCVFQPLCLFPLHLLLFPPYDPSLYVYLCASLRVKFHLEQVVADLACEVLSSCFVLLWNVSLVVQMEVVTLPLPPSFLSYL